MSEEQPSIPQPVPTEFHLTLPKAAALAILATCHGLMPATIVLWGMRYITEIVALPVMFICLILSFAMLPAVWKMTPDE
ncbi:MAG: hypothetical protein ACRDD1_18885 [Planctomycetia bacterium]